MAVTIFVWVVGGRLDVQTNQLYGRQQNPIRVKLYSTILAKVLPSNFLGSKSGYFFPPTHTKLRFVYFTTLNGSQPAIFGE